MSSQRRINKILTEWNPLGIPMEIAETEYSDYVDAIISNMHSKVELKSWARKNADKARMYIQITVKTVSGSVFFRG